MAKYRHGEDGVATRVWFVPGRAGHSKPDPTVSRFQPPPLANGDIERIDIEPKDVRLGKIPPQREYFLTCRATDRKDAHPRAVGHLRPHKFEDFRIAVLGRRPVRLVEPLWRPKHQQRHVARFRALDQAVEKAQGVVAGNFPEMRFQPDSKCFHTQKVATSFGAKLIGTLAHSVRISKQKLLRTSLEHRQLRRIVCINQARPGRTFHIGYGGKKTLCLLLGRNEPVRCILN